MKYIHIKYLITSLFSICFCNFIVGQAHTFEVPLNRQITTSTQIIEGKVISSQSLWDANRQSIYTIHTIEVFKVFKGQVQSNLEIITEGGVVDMKAQLTTPSLDLSQGDMGVFIMEENTVQFASNEITSLNKYKPYSSFQGFYKYNEFENKVSNSYVVIEGISQRFYDMIEAQMQSKFIKVSEFDIDDHMNFLEQKRAANALEITSFNPVTISGGTKSILTINGSGFGANPGSVLFRDANDGGATFFTALASQIVSWSDTQIQVEVPSRAGTGAIRVVTAIGPSTTSASNLTVVFSEINVTSDNVAYLTQHIDDNGNGGYDWSMNINFFLNTPAKESFTRAFDTWRCETGINWDINSTFTTVNVIAFDDINIIRFDVGDELPAGVLARNISYFNGCNNGDTLDWFVAELDIVFNDSTNWQFGPAVPSASQVDFESVAVHELGHGHQLAHIIDPSAIMHYAIGSGVLNRVLAVNDILGGNDVQQRSTTIPVCGNGLMTNHSCSLGIDENDLENHILVYTNAADHTIIVKNNHYASIRNIGVYDVTGRSIQNLNYQQPLNQYTFDSSNFSTGVYFIKINVEGNTLTKKIIVQ